MLQEAWLRRKLRTSNFSPTSAAKTGKIRPTKPILRAVSKSILVAKFRIFYYT
jgi:hypothetical protein